MPGSKTTPKGGRPPLELLEDELTKKIISILKYNGGGVDRGELARRTGAPRSTIYDRLVKLDIKGIVTWHKKYRLCRGSRLPGRPKTLWHLIVETR